MESFTKFDVGGAVHYLCVNYQEGQFALTLIDERLDLWECQASVADLLGRIATGAGRAIAAEDYIDLLKAALRRQDGDWTQFEVVSQGPHLTLTVRLRTNTYGAEGVRIKAAELAFQRVVGDRRIAAMHDFLLKVVQQDAQLRKNAETYRQVEQRQGELERQAKEAVAMKSRMEQEYLEKFVHLLNEKKRRNRELEDRLAALEEDVNRLRSPQAPTVDATDGFSDVHEIRATSSSAFAVKVEEREDSDLFAQLLERVESSSESEADAEEQVGPMHTNSTRSEAVASRPVPPPGRSTVEQMEIQFDEDQDTQPLTPPPEPQHPVDHQTWRSTRLRVAEPIAADSSSGEADAKRQRRDSSLGLTQEMLE